MPRNSPQRDVTQIFAESATEGPELAGPDGVTNDTSGPVPFPDPLGLLEKLTGGRIRDPVNDTVRRFIKNPWIKSVS